MDRFKIVTHYEGRLVDVYTLVAAKPKLKKADPSTRTECRSNGIATGIPTIVKCQNVTMAQFAEELNHQEPVVASRRRVVDSSGIEGSWDQHLHIELCLAGMQLQARQQTLRGDFSF